MPTLETRLLLNVLELPIMLLKVFCGEVSLELI